MRISGIDFPNSLINAIRSEELVVFAGAGVSMGPPANMPNFAGLATAISAGTSIDRAENETLDRFLGRLKNEGVDVHQRTGEILRSYGDEPTDLQRALLRLNHSYGVPRIVTTNFDLLFERAAKEIVADDLDSFVAPALPLGRSFSGIVHVHGDLNQVYSMVLTDSDFGRAYLTEGWARRFLVDVFRHFNVLFVGYSHDDTILSYLARALPPDDQRDRFVLTSDRSLSRWENLGVQAIAYPVSDGGHEGLYQGVAGLARYVSRGILEWRQQIEAIACRNPAVLDQEELDLIEDALSDITRTRFFAAAATEPEWIEWIDNRGHLDGLFELKDLAPHESELADWLGRKYVRDHSDDLFALIGKHGQRLNRELWYRLGFHIGNHGNAPVTQDELVKWVAILLDTIPQDIHKSQFLWILEQLSRRCCAYGLTDSLIGIFRAIVRVRPRIPSGIDSMTVELTGDYHEINTLWQDQFKPNLESMSDVLLPFIVDQLRAQHRLYEWFGRGNRRIDSASLRRAAIEPHAQDRLRSDVDALIDAARDCLEELAVSSAAAASFWCDTLSGSQVPLLRRLAVHALTKRTDLSDDDRIDWLLANVELHDLAIHHEAYRAVRLVYPAASQEFRERIVDAILEHEGPVDDDPDGMVAAARNKYDWLEWVHRAIPDCSIAKSALDDLASAYPGFQPREDSDLVFTMQVGFVGSESPWSAQELLSRPPADWLNELLEYEGTMLDGPNRDGLLSEVEQAASRDFGWGASLADLMVESSRWDCDLWGALWGSWSAELDEEKHRQVLDLAYTPELLRNHTRPIADLVLSILKDGGLPYASELLGNTNRIAIALRQHLGEHSAISGRRDFLFQAINHPAGILAEYWLQSLAAWRRSEDPVPDRFCDPYLAELSAIVADKGLPGTLEKAVLCSRIAFLLNADYNWSMQHLIPLFTDESHTDDLQASWHGFVFGSGLNPQVAEVMESSFLSSIARVGTIFPEEDLRHLFIQRIAAMVIFFVDDPLSEWIPKLFRYADTAEDRRQFVGAIGNVLRNMSDANQQNLWERFVRPYWENRIHGVPPQSLQAIEVQAMMKWLPTLKGVYPEAVELVIRTPGAVLEDGMLLYVITQEKVWEAYPEATARLLLHFGALAGGQTGHEWYGAKELIDSLLGLDISADARAGLEDLVVRLGLT
ncbi:MAG: DUF4020 domain-containing protein [Chloroflexota bacterium]|nr:DUF4020 domain-containing protein [Chloroflexota bacterium]